MKNRFTDGHVQLSSSFLLVLEALEWLKLTLNVISNGSLAPSEISVVIEFLMTML